MDLDKQLKAKYAEIAALKKAIDEKSHKMTRNGPPSLPARPFIPRPVHKIRKPPRRHQNLTLVVKNETSTSTGKSELPVTSGFNSDSIAQTQADAKMLSGNIGDQDNDISLSGDTNNSSNSNSNSNSKSSTSYIKTITGGGNTIMSIEQYEKQIKAQELQQIYKKEQMERLRQQKIFYQRQKMVIKNMQDSEECDRVRINGDVFAVTLLGAKLLLLSMPEPWKNQGNITWNNVSYIRLPGGDLNRVDPSRGRTQVPLCKYFVSSGICQRGTNCPFLHDSSKMKLCRNIGKGSATCLNERCLLSHQSTQFNTQLCRYNLIGKCSNSICSFLHHKPARYEDPNTSILVCRPFAYSGVCERGKLCPFLHLFRCPDFEERGICPRDKGCGLEHQLTRQVQQNILNSGSTDDSNLENVDKTSSEVNSSIFVEGDNVEKQIVSSFTVEPLLLFVRPNEKYDVYIDPKPEPLQQPDHEFMIMLHSDSESDSEIDEVRLEDNEDFVQIGEELI